MSALESVVREVKVHGVPDLFSRGEQREARNYLARTVTPNGTVTDRLELIPRDGGRPIELLVVNLWAFLDDVFRKGGAMRDLILERHASTPSSIDRPWRLILYTDEVVPGLQLAARDLRKFWAAYASFLEFGPLTLSNELAWVTLAVKAAHEVANASAGVSQMFKEIVKFLFCSDIDPTIVGIVLGSHDGEHVRLFVKLGMFLMDGDAHRALLACKGDAAMKPCPLCGNLYTMKSGIVQEDGTDMLCCSLIHEEELVFSSDDDVLGTVDRLAARKLTDTDAIFRKREQVVGFRHEPCGLLLARELRGIVRPVSQYCHDTQHTLFVNGIFNTTVYLFFETLFLGGMLGIYDATEAFLNGWEWAKEYHMSDVADVFSHSRVESWRKSKHLKCTAGEALGLCLVLAHFVSSVIQPRFPNQCAAFLLMCSMIKAFVCVPFGMVSHVVLKHRIKAFLDQCVIAGWRNFFHPKFHWVVHMPTHLLKFGWLPSCWVLERKHKTGKAYGADIKNTVDYDRTLLFECTCHHMFELSQPNVFSLRVGLASPRAAPKRMKAFLKNVFDLDAADVATITTSVISRYSYIGTCHRGDVVLVQQGADLLAAEVWFHCEILSVPLTLVQLWSPISRDPAAGSAKWNPDKNPQVFETEHIRGVCTYKRYSTYVLTLAPAHLRD